MNSILFHVITQSIFNNKRGSLLSWTRHKNPSNYAENLFHKTFTCFNLDDVAKPEEYKPIGLKWVRPTWRRRQKITESFQPLSKRSNWSSYSFLDHPYLLLPDTIHSRDMAIWLWLWYGVPATDLTYIQTVPELANSYVPAEFVKRHFKIRIVVSSTFQNDIEKRKEKKKHKLSISMPETELTASIGNISDYALTIGDPIML
jgi:hypothetical protein